MLKLNEVPSRPLVAASILSADFGRIADECADALDKGADLLHLDVMDGHFVPNLTMGVDMCRALRHHFPQTFLDVHLMVDEPWNFVSTFADAGANLLTVHCEICRPWSLAGPEPGTVIEQIHAAGALAGMAFNPATSADVEADVLAALDLLLVMSVNPGRSGQSFMPDVLKKTRDLHARAGAATRIEMDGGLSPATATAAVAAGCQILVTASALFEAKDRAAVIHAMHNAGPT